MKKIDLIRMSLDEIRKDADAIYEHMLLQKSEDVSSETFDDVLEDVRTRLRDTLSVTNDFRNIVDCMDDFTIKMKDLANDVIYEHKDK